LLSGGDSGAGRPDSLSELAPVDDLQIVDPLEVTDIAGHDRQLLCAGSRGDGDIVQVVERLFVVSECCDDDRCGLRDRS
jgi:hypothetical protein